VGRIAVVIPCFKVRDHVLGVIAAMPPEVERIYVVDDACPEGTGAHVEASCRDARVRVLRNESNQGVGGATLRGYEEALADGADFLVKLDGDGQMDPSRIPSLVAPLADGSADYTKGNRFFDLEDVRSMPAIRLVGNAILSFVNKVASGYWDVMDPTNGYTAIHAVVARALPLRKIARDYFFESDMLFRLSVLRAVVVDVPMAARYGDEVSNLRVSKVFSIGRARLEAIGEVFNLFNAINPSNIVAGASANRRVNTPAGPPDQTLLQPASFSGDSQRPEQRVGQIGLRFTF